ncbi:hypothetical protein H5410_031357 [Solanum commersonii]|uniref:Uncharacterized protein n=1 Tax=Solanum commersonii TaxID=4109 RepID=A0A9J5YGX1_SOLCO|nr:hypothetical protein H5410_031357 [Solanum commersonii]
MVIPQEYKSQSGRRSTEIKHAKRSIPYEIPRLRNNPCHDKERTLCKSNQKVEGHTSILKR